MFHKTSINAKIQEINGRPFYPVELGKVNDHVVRLALFDGAFQWHKHDNEEELFMIHSGEIVIQFKDRDDVILKTGDVFVVPKGIEHCPKSIEPSYVLMFEPLETESQGD